jgi:hypothetical protein
MEQASRQLQSYLEAGDAEKLALFADGETGATRLRAALDYAKYAYFGADTATQGQLRFQRLAAESMLAGNLPDALATSTMERQVRSTVLAALGRTEEAEAMATQRFVAPVVRAHGDGPNHPAPGEHKLPTEPKIGTRPGVEGAPVAGRSRSAESDWEAADQPAAPFDWRQSALDLDQISPKIPALHGFRGGAWRRLDQGELARRRVNVGWDGVLRRGSGQAVQGSHNFVLSRSGDLYVGAEPEVVLGNGQPVLVSGRIRVEDGRIRELSPGTDYPVDDLVFEPFVDLLAEAGVDRAAMTVHQAEWESSHLDLDWDEAPSGRGGQLADQAGEAGSDDLGSDLGEFDEFADLDGSTSITDRVGRSEFEERLARYGASTLDGGGFFSDAVSPREWRDIRSSLLYTGDRPSQGNAWSEHTSQPNPPQRTIDWGEPAPPVVGRRTALAEAREVELELAQERETLLHLDRLRQAVTDAPGLLKQVPDELRPEIVEWINAGPRTSAGSGSALERLDWALSRPDLEAFFAAAAPLHPSLRFLNGEFLAAHGRFEEACQQFTQTGYGNARLVELRKLVVTFEMDASVSRFRSALIGIPGPDGVVSNLLELDPGTLRQVIDHHRLYANRALIQELQLARYLAGEPVEVPTTFTNVRMRQAWQLVLAAGTRP